MRILGVLLPPSAIGAFCGMLCMPCISIAHCHLRPNPYLRRVIADNLLLDVKAARDDGRSAAKTLSELQKKVPLINRLAIKKNMFGQTIVELTLEQPWVILVCEGLTPRVLTRAGTTAPTSLMRDDVLANLATIVISKNTNTPEQITLLAQWLGQQPDNFFSRFTVFWRDKSDIQVQDALLPLITIRATHETIFNDRVLAFLGDIKEKDRLYTTIDLRFGDEQIILVPKISRGKKI